MGLKGFLSLAENELLSSSLLATPASVCKFAASLYRVREVGLLDPDATERYTRRWMSAVGECTEKENLCAFKGGSTKKGK